MIHRIACTLIVAAAAAAAAAQAQDQAEGPEERVRRTLLAWGQAWTPGDHAEGFELGPLFDRFYAEDVLAFDTSDQAQRTVIRGRDAFLATWEPFVRSWDRWAFNVLPESIEVHVVDAATAWATLYVDNFGLAHDGTEFHGPAQGTVILHRDPAGAWRIVHEHISLPRRDPAR